MREKGRKWGSEKVMELWGYEVILKNHLPKFNNSPNHQMNLGRRNERGIVLGYCLLQNVIVKKGTHPHLPTRRPLMCLTPKSQRPILDNLIESYQQPLFTGFQSGLKCHNYYHWKELVMRWWSDGWESEFRIMDVFLSPFNFRNYPARGCAFHISDRAGGKIWHWSES